MEELPQLDPLERRATLDQATYDRLAPVPGVLAALYASYALAHALGVDADAVRWPVAASTGLTALALLLLHLVRRRGLVPVRRAAWFAAPIAALLLWNCRTYLALTDEPSIAMYFMFVMVGTGLVVLSWPVVVGTTAGAWVGFLSVATLTGPRGLEWQHVGIGLVTATALTVIVHAARIRATLRLAALVAAERERSRALGAALQSLGESETRLRAARSELEVRVRERTCELEAANAALRDEIEERRRIGERLLRYGQALEASTDAIILAELDGTIVDVNTALVTLCGGAGKEQIVGRSLVALAAPEDRARAAQGFADVLAGVGGPAQEFSLLKLDDERVPVEAALAVVNDERGEPCGLVAVGRDITRRRQLETSLRHNEAYLRTLIEHSTDTIAVLDVDGTVLARLESADEPIGRFGFAASSVLGRFGQSFVHADDAERVIATFLDLTERPGESARVECRVRAGEGGYRPAEIVFCNLVEDPAVAGVMCSLRDLTEQKRAEAELRVARDAAEAASHAKSEFLSTMSHELRTPIHAVLGYAEMLDDGAFGELNDEQREIVQRITDRARDQFELVAAVLDLSAMDAGRATVHAGPVPLAEVCAVVDREGRKAWSESRLALAWDVPADLPVLLSDAGKIKIVVRNLVANAVKFTGRGCVTVRARAARDGVEIAVTDTGIGIAPEHREAIFAPFFQLDGSESRRYEGSGLGLHIVKRLLDLLGGTIAVESEVGRGSTFRVWLPLAPAAAGVAADAAAPCGDETAVTPAEPAPAPLG